MFFRIVHARGAIPNEEEDFVTSGVGVAGEAGPSHFGVALVLAKVSIPSVQLAAYSVASGSSFSLTETMIWIIPSPYSAEKISGRRGGME